MDGLSVFIFYGLKGLRHRKRWRKREYKDVKSSERNRPHNRGMERGVEGIRKAETR